MATWVDEYLKMIDDCKKRESRISEWECSFIESIRARLEQEKLLSPKQVETLDKIWERATELG
jgi:hypothetical protein